MFVLSCDGLTPWLVRSIVPILSPSPCKILTHDALQFGHLVLRLFLGVDMHVKNSLFLLHLLQVRNHDRLPQYHSRPWRHLQSDTWLDTSWYWTFLTLHSFNQSSLCGQTFSKPSHKAFTGLISKWSSGGGKTSIVGILLSRLSDTMGSCITLSWCFACLLLVFALK